MMRSSISTSSRDRRGANGGPPSSRTTFCCTPTSLRSGESAKFRCLSLNLALLPEFWLELLLPGADRPYPAAAVDPAGLCLSRPAAVDLGIRYRGLIPDHNRARYA